MVLGRQILVFLLSVAVAMAPVGAAAAGAHASKAQPAQAHAAHHDHAAMQLAASDQDAAQPCHKKTIRSCCCDDKGACAQSCLQKCFGQAAVLVPDRIARSVIVQCFAARPSERPPDWSLAPQPPPPRA